MVHLNYFCRSILFTSTSQMKALMYLRDTKHHHQSLLLQVDHTWMRVWMHHPTHQLVFHHHKYYLHPYIYQLLRLLQPCRCHSSSLNSQLDLDIELQRRSVWCGFVLVGDNIDKSVYARHQTMESRNRSLHYFNSCAVLDRCDFSHLSDFQSPPDRNSYDVSHLLPSNEDLEAILLHFATLVGRMLTIHVPGFEKYISWTSQIKHKYCTEMKRKSDVVNPLHVCYHSIIYFRYFL